MSRDGREGEVMDGSGAVVDVDEWWWERTTVSQWLDNGTEWHIDPKTRLFKVTVDEDLCEYLCEIGEPDDATPHIEEVDDE